MLGNFACFVDFCGFYFLKLTFSKISFRNTISVSNSSDQARHFLRTDLALNCLKNLSADDTSPIAGKELRVNH